MTADTEKSVLQICKNYGNDRNRMMDIVRDTQQALGCVCDEAVDLIAKATKAHRVEVEGVVSFYAFFSTKPKGPIVIRLCDDIIDEMANSGRVAKAFKEALGVDFGQTTSDGKMTLEWTPCIGLCDQAPAALINDVPITELSTDLVWQIVHELRVHGDPQKLVTRLGDGNNAHDLVHSMVKNHIRKRGPVVFDDLGAGEAIRKAIALSPQEVIRDMKTSRLRGRGGAGFPTGIKWEYTRAAEGPRRYVICNADEGEPGTFKDRVILTERPNLLIEGMTIAGYAIGSDTGIIYLRAEYAYLRAFLEHVLAERRSAGLLGKNICGKAGFDFDIRIQMGAGAYICGEETALISSCEGLRGDPKTRPPFPAQKGYLGCPTSVNNVETYCCVARIVEKGAGWFAQLGSKGSSGTKLLSISGDCKIPGVYEVPFGIKLSEVLKLCGADDAAAVQVGGPSGVMVGPADYERVICYDDLATGGSIMVFGPRRDLLQVVEKFMDFFVEESCGYCTPCRVGNVLLKQSLQQIHTGHGRAEDLVYLEELGQTIKAASRCGLGQTSPNPILSTLKNFRPAYEAVLVKQANGNVLKFDLKAAVADAEHTVARRSGHIVPEAGSRHE